MNMRFLLAVTLLSVSGWQSVAAEQFGQPKGPPSLEVMRTQPMYQAEGGACDSPLTYCYGAQSFVWRDSSGHLVTSFQVLEWEFTSNTTKYREIRCSYDEGSVTASSYLKVLKNSAVISPVSLDPESSDCTTTGFSEVTDPYSSVPYGYSEVVSLEAYWNSPNVVKQTNELVTTSVTSTGARSQSTCKDVRGEDMMAGGIAINGTFRPFVFPVSPHDGYSWFDRRDCTLSSR